MCVCYDLNGYVCCNTSFLALILYIVYIVELYIIIQFKLMQLFVL
jgi:hypothetical protein